MAGRSKDAGRATARLDLTGLLLVSPGLAALIYGLSEVGNQGGFGHARVLVPMAGGALLVVAFALRALRTAQPLVDLRLFRVRAFAVSSALTFTSGLTLFGGMFLPLYYQQVRHESVIAAGLLLVPQGIGALLARTTGGLTDRLGPRPIAVTGLLLTALGTLPFAAHTHDDLFLSLALVVRGFGMSAANLALMVGAFQGLAPSASRTPAPPPGSCSSSAAPSARPSSPSCSNAVAAPPPPSPTPSCGRPSSRSSRSVSHSCSPHYRRR